MEASTTQILINFFTNFNLKIVLNFFTYSGAVSLGVLVTIKVTEGVVYVSTLKYKRRAEEIKECNRKMHDRLIDIGFDKKPEDFARNQKRILYTASRLKKYDKTIFEDVNRLLSVLSTGNGESVSKEDLIERIREKVDKLWFKSR